MALVKITDSFGNDTFNEDGKFSFDIDYDENAVIRSIKGAYSSSEGYLEDIMRLETDQYILDDISVYNEAYGSESNEIVYSFTAKSYAIKHP